VFMRRTMERENKEGDDRTSAIRGRKGWASVLLGWSGAGGVAG
jgi:hypothetical protein